MKVTSKDFTAYEQVRESGACNMFDLKTVQALSGLDTDTIKAIIKEYDRYSKLYS